MDKVPWNPARTGNVGESSISDKKNEVQQKRIHLRAKLQLGSASPTLNVPGVYACMGVWQTTPPQCRYGDTCKCSAATEVFLQTVEKIEEIPD